MKSPTLPKVLHGFAGRSLLGHVLAATRGLAARHTVVVIGHRRDAVREHLATIAAWRDSGGAGRAARHRPCGTGRARHRAARRARARSWWCPAMRRCSPRPRSAPSSPSTSARVPRPPCSAASPTIPTGYGRVIRDAEGGVTRIVEHKDATDCRAGDHRGRGQRLRLRPCPAARRRRPPVEGQLPGRGVPARRRLDPCRRRAARCRAVVAPHDETAGVNDRVQLAAAHRTYNARLLDAHMRAGRHRRRPGHDLGRPDGHPRTRRDPAALGRPARRHHDRHRRDDRPADHAGRHHRRRRHRRSRAQSAANPRSATT